MSLDVVRPAVARGGRGVPLTLLRPDTGTTVVAVSGDPALRHQLGNLGFVAGSPVRVVARRDGDVIVVVRGARLALDRDAARHVMTEDAR